MQVLFFHLKFYFGSSECFWTHWNCGCYEKFLARQAVGKIFVGSFGHGNHGIFK